MSKIVGILGAGQLASMIARSVINRGLEVAVYAQSLDEPACSLAQNVMLAKVNDRESLERFFQFCSVIILENEFFDAELLALFVNETQTKVYPEIQSYKNLSSKLEQKKFFKKCSIPMADTIEISCEKDLEQIQVPVMFKISSGGYDGYGNLLVTEQKDLSKKVKQFSNDYSKIVFAEKFIEIKNEYAVMLVKGKNNYIMLPPVKTFQKENICHIVDYPAGLSESQSLLLEKYIQTINDKIDGVGVYAFEFFETSDGELLINEAAPRVHNSYHFSMEGFNRSQFDLIVDIALEENIENVQECYPYASMINLLGQSPRKNYQLEIPEFSDCIDFKVHMYGKKESRSGRKMGHITLVSENETGQLAQKIQQEYRL